ncbi:TIGR01777 family oxidoreductase [Flagellimonas sp. DF-77]|uniref:TIGR01777 family oxidoreductase n=1 Tax=Flagellimonas algarum TaxID=3230298 RepID=UPI0033985FAD
MRVLVTGATGLVGKALVKELHRMDIAVSYLTTNRDKLEDGANYQGFYWNPKEGQIDTACFEGVGAVINLAGATISKRWSDSYKKTVLESRIDSINTLHKGMVEFGPDAIQQLISASAIGRYPYSLTELYEEDEKAVDDSFLGEVVAQWEEALDIFKPLNCTVAKIRIGIVLSTDGGALPQMIAPIKMGMGAAFGSGLQWQSWIHIDDLAKLFTFVLTEKLKGVYNAVAPNPVTNKKLTRQLAKTLRMPLFLPNIPKFVMSATLGEMAYLLFASQRVSSKRIEKKGFVFSYPNIDMAVAQLLKPDAVSPEPNSSATAQKKYA